jgi:hypothetical protein
MGLATPNKCNEAQANLAPSLTWLVGVVKPLKEANLSRRVRLQPNRAGVCL